MPIPRDSVGVMRTLTGFCVSFILRKLTLLWFGKTTSLPKTYFSLTPDHVNAWAGNHPFKFFYTEWRTWLDNSSFVKLIVPYPAKTFTILLYEYTCNKFLMNSFFQFYNCIKIIVSIATNDQILVSWLKLLILFGFVLCCVLYFSRFMTISLREYFAFFYDNRCRDYFSFGVWSLYSVLFWGNSRYL